MRKKKITEEEIREAWECASAERPGAWPSELVFRVADKAGCCPRTAYLKLRMLGLHTRALTKGKRLSEGARAAAAWRKVKEAEPGVSFLTGLAKTAEAVGMSQPGVAYAILRWADAEGRI